MIRFQRPASIVTLLAFTCAPGSIALLEKNINLVTCVQELYTERSPRTEVKTWDAMHSDGVTGRESWSALCGSAPYPTVISS